MYPEILLGSAEHTLGTTGLEDRRKIVECLTSSSASAGTRTENELHSVQIRCILYGINFSCTSKCKLFCGICKTQTPGNYPEESIQHSEHSESLKSRVNYFVLKMNWSYHPAAGYVLSNRRLVLVFIVFYLFGPDLENLLMAQMM
jgi:hypothetical protein